MKTERSLSTKKQRSLKLAKQARGTLNKIILMIEQDAYCPEIIQQTDSVAGLLKTARKELLAGHLNACLTDRIKEDRNKAIAELLKIYNLSS